MSDAAPPPLVRRIVVSVIVVAVALGGGHVLLKKLAGLRTDPERSAKGAALPVVRVESLTRRDHREMLRGYGVARALRGARVSAEVGGIVREVSDDLEVGRTVGPSGRATNGSSDGAPGSPPLVRIDRQDLDDGLARLRAERRQGVAERARTEADARNLAVQLEVAARRLSTAKSELRRILSLVPDTLPESDADRQRLAVFALEQIESELVSRREQAQASVAVIDARLEVLDAQINKALRDLERTLVYAPYAGRVAAKYVERGALVAPGTPLFDLVDPQVVEVAISLPASRYGQVVATGEGDAVSRVALRFHEDGEVVWRGEVARIDPRVDPEARTFGAYVVVEGQTATRTIPPGAHVVADVEGGIYRDVVVVPREAFVQDTVYVVRPTDVADVWEAHEVRPVIRAVLAGVMLAEPGADSEGLGDGDPVVVTNLEDVAEGSRLRILLSAQED